MNTNRTIPQRTHKADELIINLALSVQGWQGVKPTDPEEINATLAFCEIITSLPIEWFTMEERNLVVMTVDFLHKDGFLSFMERTTNGEVSYYAKMMHVCDMNDHPHSDLQLVLDKMLEMHQRQFGV